MLDRHKPIVHPLPLWCICINLFTLRVGGWVGRFEHVDAWKTWKHINHLFLFWMSHHVHMDNMEAPSPLWCTCIDVCSWSVYKCIHTSIIYPIEPMNKFKEWPSIHPSLLRCTCINIFNIRVGWLIDMVCAILYIMKEESMQRRRGWVGWPIRSCLFMESIQLYPSIHYCF